MNHVSNNNINSNNHLESHGETPATTPQHSNNSYYYYGIMIHLSLLQRYFCRTVVL